MNLTYETTATGYKIFRDGTPWIVQDGYIPYKKATMAESAQAHIDEIVRANEASKQAVQEEKDIKQKVADLEAKIAELEATNLDLMEVALTEKGALINE